MVNAQEILDEVNATVIQRKWVVERLRLKSDAAAARAVGLHPNSVYRWPNKAQLDRAVELLLADVVAAARLILLHSGPEAARTLVRHLLGKDAVRAADSILDRIGVVHVKQVKHELSGPEGGPVEIKYGADKFDAYLARLLAAIGIEADSSGQEDGEDN